MLSKGIFLLAVLTVGSLTVAEDDWSDEYQNDEAPAISQCAVTCPASSSSSKFGYETGKTYQYRYESDIKTSAPGGTAEHSSLHMRASVQIEVVSTCEMTLKLTDVSLQDSNPTNFESRQHIENAASFRRGLQAKTTSFSFVDGQIETVCPDAADEIWALNIKRGILSALQNTMTSLQGASNGRELDISGNCPVRYEQLSSGWGGARTVKKTKNLLGCTDREAGRTIFQAVQYDADSDIQSMPLLKSTHVCEQEISRERILTKTTCTEVHVFRPFSGQNSGATTEVNYKLEFQSKSDGVSTQQAASRVSSNLLYDHRPSDEEMTDTVREARASLTELCRQTEADVRPEAPGTFNGLVKQMRKLDGANLKRLLALSKNGLCAKAERYFRDALPVLGTTGAVIVMRDLMAQSQADDSEIDRWMTSIAFISNPTPDMMNELQSLLTSDFERASLPVSSLVNTYCQLYDDRDSAVVQQMIKTIEDELRYNCKYETEAQRARIVKALKAIGNAGNAERVVPTLNRCIANAELPVAVRVAAITSFRRLSCSADRKDLATLLEDKQADSELRIMAYLAVMQCANEEVINRVKDVLQSNEVNQVGSFIWTHLTNIQETSCPMKAEIQALLKDVVLSKSYDLDKRKFSRNIELSGFSEVFNVGAMAESNLIWSSQSYIPRSASVNLTFDVFGQSVNLLEFGGRVQGVESLLERFFGPGKDSENSIREKRAVIRDDAFNIIDRKFPKSRDDLALSYYLRVFGNEIRSGEVADLDLEGLKNRFNFLNWLIMLAQENRIDVTKNFLFLDSTFTAPTGVGLPLTLGVEGTATVAITASGKADLRQMFSFPSIFDINGSIRPSAAIEIRGEMGVDARFSKTGLKTVNRLHTSTILDGKIQLQDGKIFNLDLNLPQEKVEIFSAESHVYVTYRGQDREQVNLRPGAFKKTECTCPTIAYIFGVEMCAEVALDGPFVGKAYVNKKDTYTGFHFEAGLRQSRAEMTDTVKISMSTPGSRIDREITAEFKLDRANTEVTMDLKSPWKKVNAQGSVVNSAALKRALFRAKIDDALEYSLNAEVQIDNKAQEVRYLPNVKVTYPDREGQATEVVFDGTVVYTKGKKVAVNLALRNAFLQPITLDGSIERQEKRKTIKYDTNIQFNSQRVKGGLVGFVSNIQDNGNTWSSRADLSYQIVGARNKERILINHKFRDLSTSNLRSYSTDCSWTLTVNPRLNGQVGLELAFSPNSLRTKIEVGQEDVKKVTIIQSGAFDFSGNDKKINGMVKFELPYKNWDYEMKVDHIYNTDTLQSNATVRYGESKQASLDIGLKKENDRFLKLSGEAIFRMPNVDMSITQSLIERAPREYYGELSLQGIPKVGTARVSTVYKMLPRHEFSADINVANWEPISVKGHLNPSLSNLQVRGEFSQGSRNFMGDVNWLHRGTVQAFNTKANAEVGYYGKSHAATVELTRRNQEFSVNAELKLAEDKKFTLSSQITANPTEPKVQIRVEGPSDFVELTALGKYETKGWYTTTNDVEGKIQFASSIPRLELLGASFRHDQSAESMKSNGELIWASDKKITGDFSYDKSKIAVDIVTPFEGYETLKGEAAYTPRGKLLGHTTKLSWNTNQMVLAISGELNSPSVNGRVTFTSPFKGFESLSTNLKHVVSGDKYTTTADASWARGQQISVTMNMNHNRNGWSVTNNGDVAVQTPFRGYRVSKLTWSHQNDESSLKCRHEVELDRQKYTVEVDSSHRLTRAARLVAATASFQSPIKGLEDLRFSTEIQHDLRAVKCTGKSSVSWGANSITHEHEVAFVPNTLLLVKGQITTPYAGYEMMKLDMNNRRSGNTFTASNELSIGKYGTSTLGGTLTYQGYTLDANLRLTTPSRSLERVAASIRNIKQDDVWISGGSFEYAPDKSISATTKLGWESQKKFEVEINTPLSSMRSMKFNSEITGTARNFQISSELEHNLLQNKITFVAAADSENARRLSANVAITTPFAALSNFKVTAGHTKETAQRCVTIATYEFNNNRGSLNTETNFRSWQNINTKTEIEYINGRKIVLSNVFTFEPTSSEAFLPDANIRVLSKLTTPFECLERAGFEINHFGTPNNYRGEATFELNDKKIVSTGLFKLEDAGFQFNGQLETPFRTLRQASASLGHNRQDRRFNCNAELTYDRNTISASSEFNLDGPAGKFTLRTPYSAVQTVNLEFSHEVKTGRQNNGWTNKATLEFNDNKYTGESDLTFTGKVLRAKAAVKIPEEYSITLQHRGDSVKDFSNTVTLKLDDNTVTGSTSFKYASQLIDGKATLETTYQGYNKFETTFKHEGPISDFKTRFTVATPFRNHRSFATELIYRGNPADFTSSLSYEANRQSPAIVSLSYKSDGSILEANVKLQTPYDGYEAFEANYKYNGEPSNFRTSAMITTPFNGYERFYIELNHAGQWNRFTTSGKFESSVTSTVAFSLDNTSPNAWGINTAVNVDIPAGKIGVTFTNNGEPGNFRSQLAVTTPYRAYNRFEVSLEHEGGVSSPKSKVTVQTPFRGYNKFQLSTEKSGNGKNLQLKAELTTPIRNWERTAASWSHNVENTIQLNGQIETSFSGLDKITGSLSHSGAADNFQMTISLETPIRNYERQTISINHAARRNIKTTVTFETSLPGYSRFIGNFEHSSTRRATKTSVTIETPIRGAERFSGATEINTNDANSFGASIQVTTPIRGYERFGATFNHNGDLSQFETSAKITTPLEQMPQIEATLRHRGQIDDFSTNFKVEYSGKTIETETTFKRTASRYDSNYDGTFKFNSPCPYLRDFTFVASHGRQPEVKTGALDITYNGEKKVGMDYRYTTSGDQQLDINIRNPYSMSTRLNMAGGDGQAVVNWDTTRADKQVKFDFGFKDVATSELTDRSMRFKVAASQRILGFEFGYTLTADKFTNRGELQWDSDPESEFIYEVEGSKTASRYVTSYDGKVKVTSALMTTTSTFSHKSQVRRKQSTELVIETTTERLRISNEVVTTANGLTHTFIVQHPRFTQDININTEYTATDKSNGVKTTVRYERQSFTVEGQVTDESGSGSLRSSGTFRFVHPNSQTDVQLTGDVFCNDEKSGANGELQYQMSRDRSTQRVSMKTELNKANKDLTFEVTLPFDRLRLAATNRYAGNSNGMYGYEFAAQTNQINLKAVTVASRNDRSFDAKLFYTESDYVHLFAQAFSGLQARFELSRYINNGFANDITANLSFSDERILAGYAFVRPNLKDEYRSLVRPDRLYSRDQAAQGQEWANALSDDFTLKSQRLRNAVTPIINAALAIASDVNAKADQAKAEYNALYNRNDFYIRDMHVALKRVSDKITERVQYKMTELKRSYDEFAIRAQRYMIAYNRMVSQRMEEVYRQIAESLEVTANKFAELQPHFDNAVRTLQARFIELSETIRNHPRLVALAERLNAYRFADWQESATKAYQDYRKQIDEILSRPELREVRDWVINQVEESMWMYEYFGYREQVTLWIEQARAFTWQAFKTKAVEYVKQTLQLHRNRWTSWDVSRGEYAFEAYIPFDPRDASFVQRFTLRKYVTYARNAIAKLIPDEEWTLLDTVFSYWPSNNPYNWIPPFKSHASITGSQHFVTFDHKSYEFAGECSYLLTRDFVDKSFSVVVNFDKMNNNRPVRKSITVVSEGKQIEVYPDAKVTVDGVRSEMPLRVSNTTVSRTGNAIRVDSDRGFSVVCDLVHDHCSISVSGWYYNKMAGLFGTYDNEPWNDLTTIDNTVTDRPELLAYGWTVGQKCKTNNRAIVQTLDTESAAYEMCARHFKNARSSFRSCYRVVDPEPYIQMCVNDMSESVSEANVCNVAAAYIQDCKQHEVHLRMPKSCVRCEIEDSEQTYLESSSYNYDDSNPAPKMADVVFIVQHSSCNKNLLEKVKGLVDDLEKAMKAEDLTNTRYSVVGFGGKDHLSSPHAHTMDSQIFNSANKVVQGLSKFDLEAGEVKDPMAAVRFAAKLAFRAGASKSFILLACDKCTEESIRYRDLQRALLESDIKLHVLVQEIIKLKSHSTKTAYIFGADKETVYTRQDVAGDDLRGEPDLRNYILIPKDLCVALTQDTSGSIFSSRQWLDSRPIIQKRFTDVMVRTFARKAQPSKCQVCECVADDFGVGYSRCSNCYAPSPVYWWYPEFESDETIAVVPIPAKEVKPSAPVSGEATTRPNRVIPTRKQRPSQPVRPAVRPPRPAARPAAPRRPAAAVRPRPQPQQQAAQ